MNEDTESNKMKKERYCKNKQSRKGIKHKNRAIKNRWTKQNKK